ncbi:MAG: acyltransferase [Pseudomonadota bacterium]
MTALSTNPAPSPQPRMEVLDGMRGLAALAVVAYHFFVRWAEPHFTPTLYQHGDALAGWFPLEIGGAFGVRLFFLISGFVIMMTLERSTGLVDFAVRRAARLWPTLLVCATLSAILINASGISAIYENVARYEVTPVEYWSSIFFIPPDLTAGLLGISQADTPRWVEGVYWTLWAEVRFYALIALVYWISPRAAFLWAWAGVQVASTGLDAARVSGLAFTGDGALTLLIQPQMLGWFTLGLAAWKAREGTRSVALSIAAAAACVSLLIGPVISLQAGQPSLSDGAIREIAILLAVIAPFLLFLKGSRVLAPLGWQPIVTLGLISYPLYLFHERPAMAYLHWINSAGLPPWPSVAMAFAIVISTAWALHKCVEMPAKRLVTRALLPRANGLEARFPALKMRANLASTG